MFSAVLCIYARTCLALEGDFGWVLIGQKMIAFEENSWQLAYLPDKKREYVIDDDALSHASELSVEGRDDITNLDELVKDYKRNRRRGMLRWLKLKSKVGDRLHTSMDVS